MTWGRFTYLCVLTAGMSVGLAIRTSTAEQATPRNIAAKKAEILELLRNDPALAAAVYKDLQSNRSKTKGQAKKKTGRTSEEIFSEAVRRSNPPPPAADSRPLTKEEMCAQAQRLFIRKDNIDSWFYGIATVDKAVGASVSYTDNRVTRSRTAQLDGFVAYVLAREPCDGSSAVSDHTRMQYSGYVIAPWVSGHGNFNFTNPSAERSALKLGVDAQIEFAGGIFDSQYLTFTPYFQTDFRSIAEIYGISARWEPFRLDWRIGGSYRRFSEFFDWFVQLKAETDLRNVQDRGLTGLARGDYAWFGTTARLHVFFFPGAAFVPTEIRDRFRYVGTFYYYWDANSGRSINRHTSELIYNFAADGSSSISLTYDKGTVQETLAAVHQYLVKLTYKQ